MARLWLTYAWLDNEQQDVDYVAQSLRDAGLDVVLDRYHIGAGRRLWDQIGAAIDDPATDAWAIFATPASLASEACREELAYALDRTLRSRGDDFALVGIFPTAVAREDIPPAVRVRLFVHTSDDDWVERVVAAAEHRAPAIEVERIAPYFAHFSRAADGRYVLEFRPRVGEWTSVMAGVRVDDPAAMDMKFGRGHRGDWSDLGGAYYNTYDGEADINGEKWHLRKVGDPPATPQRPYFLITPAVPREIFFGHRDEQWVIIPEVLP